MSWALRDGHSVSSCANSLHFGCPPPRSVTSARFIIFCRVLAQRLAIAAPLSPNCPLGILVSLVITILDTTPLEHSWIWRCTALHILGLLLLLLPLAELPKHNISAASRANLAHKYHHGRPNPGCFSTLFLPNAAPEATARARRASFSATPHPTVNIIPQPHPHNILLRPSRRPGARSSAGRRTSTAAKFLTPDTSQRQPRLIPRLHESEPGAGPASLTPLALDGHRFHHKFGRRRHTSKNKLGSLIAGEVDFVAVWQRRQQLCSPDAKTKGDRLVRPSPGMQQQTVLQRKTSLS